MKQLLCLILATIVLLALWGCAKPEPYDYTPKDPDQDTTEDVPDTTTKQDPFQNMENLDDGEDEEAPGSSKPSTPSNPGTSNPGTSNPGTSDPGSSKPEDTVTDPNAAKPEDGDISIPIG